jgi:hypothetical protein
LNLRNITTVDTTEVLIPNEYLNRNLFKYSPGHSTRASSTGRMYEYKQHQIAQQVGRAKVEVASKGEKGAGKAGRQGVGRREAARKAGWKEGGKREGGRAGGGKREGAQAKQGSQESRVERRWEAGSGKWEAGSGAGRHKAAKGGWEGVGSR